MGWERWLLSRKRILTFYDEVVEGAVGSRKSLRVDGDSARVEVERVRVRAHHPLDAAIT